jgi:hypothetical protein
MTTRTGALISAVGLAVVICGFVITGSARAEIPDPKQKFIDQMAADQAHAQSLAGQPAPVTGGRPSVAPPDFSRDQERFVRTIAASENLNGTSARRAPTSESLAIYEVRSRDDFTSRSARRAA